MRRLTLEVTGMTCEGCANAVHAALKGVEGVRRAAVSLEEDRAEVVADEGADAGAVVSAVEAAGYGARLADG